MVRFGRRLILAMLLVVWTAAVLLTNPPPPETDQADAPDLRPWPKGAPLKGLLDLAALGHRWPTESGLGIKWLILRGGATAMAVAAMVCWGLSVRRRRRPAGRGGRGPGIGPDERDELLGGPGAGESAGPGQVMVFGRPVNWRHPSGLLIGLVLLVGWMAWAALAARWSHAPREAIGYVEHMAFIVALAVVVAAALDGRLAGVAARFWLVLVAALAAVLVWFHYQRGPDRPLMVFVGDARELAGLLLAGGLLAAVLGAGRVAELLAPGGGKRAGRAAGSLLALGAIAAGSAWCIGLCGSGGWRMALLAGPAGATVAAAALTRGRWRTAWVVAGAAALAAAGWAAWASAASGGATEGAAGAGPADSPRQVAALMAEAPNAIHRVWRPPPDPPLVDGDRWAFAGRLFAERPAVGHGGWGYRLLADRVATQRAQTDPRWAGQPVGRANSFWLEQLVDLGVVGVALLAGALLAVILYAARTVRRCPRRRGRYLIAGLAGSLTALLVHQAFNSSLDRPAFAALLAGWVGLTAAAARWATRPARGLSPFRRPFAEMGTVPLVRPNERDSPLFRNGPKKGTVPMAGPDEYQLGFYPGGLTFLVGAAIALSAVGFLVVEDWRAARDHYRAVYQDIPQTAELNVQILALQQRLPNDPDLWDAPRNRSTAAELADRTIRQRDLRGQAIERLGFAVDWAIDYDLRLDAMWHQAGLAVSQVEQLIAVRSMRIIRDPRHRLLPVGTSGEWADYLAASVATLDNLGRIHPDGPHNTLGLEAQACWLMARGRTLSPLDGAPSGHVSRSGTRVRSRPMLPIEMAQSLHQSAHLLDERLANHPGDLSAVLLREALGDRRALAGELRVRMELASWLFGRARLRLSPRRRLELLRNLLRDATWPAGPASAGVWNWPAMPPRFYAALARVERDLHLANPAGAMLDVAWRVEAGQFPDWPNSPDDDVRNAPQTLRLLAELELYRNFVAARAGLPSLPSLPALPSRPPATSPDRTSANSVEPPTSQGRPQSVEPTDSLARADDFLARAGALYGQFPRRFALQRLTVAVQRAQIAWAGALPAALPMEGHASSWPPALHPPGPDEAGPSKAPAGSGRPVEAALQLAEQARRALPQVDAFHRRSAALVVATITAFLEADAGRTAEALAWYDLIAALRTGTLTDFQRQTAYRWRLWLAPQPPPDRLEASPAPPKLESLDQPAQPDLPRPSGPAAQPGLPTTQPVAPTTQPVAPTTQPERPETESIWPIFVPPIGVQLGG